MIETIRIDREYPTYAAMLMPRAKWEEFPEASIGWAFSTAGFYQALYNPKNAYDTYYDLDTEGNNKTREVFRDGISILSFAYGFTVDPSKVGERENFALDSYFGSADEFFIGPGGAEELLKEVIRQTGVVRRLVEISGVEAIK